MTVGAAVLLVLVWAVGGWAVFSGGGSDATTEPTQASIPQAAPPQQRQEAPARALGSPGAREAAARLSGRGQPIVWLRHGARIAIRTEPGGKMVKTLAWRTPFGSRTVLAVFRPAAVGGRALASVAQRPAGLGEARSLQAAGGMDALHDRRRSLAGPRSFAAATRRFARSRSRWGRPASPLRSGASRSPTPSAATSTPPTGAAPWPRPRPSRASLRVARRRPDRHPRHHGPLGVADSHGCMRAANQNVNRSSTGFGSGRRWSSGSSRLG